MGGSVKATNNKKRLDFTDPTEAELLVTELMSRTKDGTRANLRGGTGAAEMVDFRDAKN